MVTVTRSLNRHDVLLMVSLQRVFIPDIKCQDGQGNSHASKAFMHPSLCLPLASVNIRITLTQAALVLLALVAFAAVSNAQGNITAFAMGGSRLFFLIHVSMSFRFDGQSQT